MTFGEDIKALVEETIIENESLRSTLTVHKTSRTKGTYGGYGAVTETETATANIYCVPYDLFRTVFEHQSFGDLQTGNMAVVIKSDEDVEDDDYVTFNGMNYDIDNVENIVLNDVVVAVALLLKKRVSDSPSPEEIA